MRNIITIGAILCVMIICAGPAAAQQKKPGEAAVEGVIETVATGCEKELVAYCKDVTPGEGRVLACLYAHVDKLSGQCEYALFDAAAQLERAVAELTYLVNECGHDLEKHCAEVPAGEGRLVNCLNKNEKELSGRCKQALKDTGLKQDGSFTIHLGGDPKSVNYLPITEGWNFAIRLYQPRKEILDGSWTFPSIELVK